MSSAKNIQILSKTTKLHRFYIKHMFYLHKKGLTIRHKNCISVLTLDNFNVS